MEGLNSNKGQITTNHQDLIDELEALMAEMSTTQLREEILEWLSPTNYADIHSNISNERHEDTGTWFLKSEAFQQWLSKGGTLFCEGILGAGKTVLTSLVIDHFLEQVDQENCPCFAYVYCRDSRRSDQSSSTRLLSSILRQVVETSGKVPESLKLLYKTKTRTDRKLYDILFDALGLAGTTFIMIDALDQCEEKCRRTILSQMKSLQESRSVHIMATSRHSPEIHRLVSPEYQIEILATEEDLSKYLDSHLSVFADLEHQCPGLIDQARKVILKAAEGMFLMAKLCLQQLEEEMTVNEFRDELDRLSSGRGAMLRQTMMPWPGLEAKERAQMH